MRLYHENGIKSHPVWAHCSRKEYCRLPMLEINSNCGIGTVFERRIVYYSCGGKGGGAHFRKRVIYGSHGDI